MQRPLNWIVVAIALLMLFADRKVVAPGPAADPPTVASNPESPFAYVQEDGTQIFLPVPEAPSMPEPEAPPSLSFEEVHAASGFEDPADPRAAVYTWSSPVVTAELPDYPETPVQ